MARARAQDYDAKRLAILRHSAELFAQYGYAGTSIRMVAEACGASKALLYHYYTDKEAVLFDILYLHLGDLVAAVEEAARSESDPEGRVYAIVAALLEAYRDADAEHQVQLANLKHLPSKQQEQLKDMERAIVAALSDALAESLPAIGRGPLLKPLTMSVFGMLNWHYLWFREGKGITRSDYAQLVSRLVLAGSADAAASLTKRSAVPKRVKPKRSVAGRSVPGRA